MSCTQARPAFLTWSRAHPPSRVACCLIPYLSADLRALWPRSLPELVPDDCWAAPAEARARDGLRLPRRELPGLLPPVHGARVLRDHVPRLAVVRFGTAAGELALALTLTPTPTPTPTLTLTLTLT